MKNISRLLIGPVLFLVLSAGSCGTGAIQPPTPAQVVADLTGLVQTLTTVETGVVTADPKALTSAQQTTLTTALANAKAVLTQLNAGLPAPNGASIASQIDGYLNSVVAVLASIPSAYSVELGAASMLLPTVEAFVNQYLPASITASASANVLALRAKAALTMTPDGARVRLGIPIVHK
jgi:hypothetical protein